MKLRNYERIINILLDSSSNIDIANVTLVCDDQNYEIAKETSLLVKSQSPGSDLENKTHFQLTFELSRH